MPPTGSRISFAEQSAEVLQINREDSALALSQPIHAGKAVVDVFHHEPCADPTTFLSMAGDYWATFWLAESTAEKISLEEIPSLPQVPPFSSTINPDQLGTAISGLSDTDGWSNYELKSLDPEAVSSLSDMFNAFASQGCWPDELLHALVCLLPKTPIASSLPDSRPIVILPSLYRLWAKVVAKAFINNILAFLPSELVGNVPRTSSVWLAMFLQFLK